MSGGDLAFETSDLTKVYGKLTAVDSVTMQVARGQVYGLMGQNGAGKTTLLSMLLDATSPTSGALSLLGVPGGRRTNPRLPIGGFLDNPSFYPYLTARENLGIVAEIKGVGPEQIDRVLKSVKLWERRSTRFRSFSLGMKQRLGLASAMMGDPELLVLDEPTNGLDPEGILEIRALIDGFARAGKTVILSSHLLAEVEKTCTHVGVIDKGRLVAQSSMEAIRSGSVHAVLRGPDPGRIVGALEQYPRTESVRREGDDVILAARDPSAREFAARTRAFRDADLSHVSEYLAGEGIFLSHLSLTERSLEDAFFELVTRSGTDAGQGSLGAESPVEEVA